MIYEYSCMSISNIFVVRYLVARFVGFIHHSDNVEKLFLYHTCIVLDLVLALYTVRKSLKLK